MKLIRSLPAKAMASAKVPKSTVILKMFTLSRWSISAITDEMTNVMAMSMFTLSSI